MVLPSPVHWPEPRQLIPRPLARGIAARALRTVAVVKCMVVFGFCWNEVFLLGTDWNQKCEAMSMY